MLKHITFVRVVAATVVLRTAISAVAILAYVLIRPDWACGGTGLFTESFRASFPIPADNVHAQAMFNCLFVPLSYLYMLSIIIFLMILPWQIGPIMRNLKEHGALIGGIILFVGSSYIFLFEPASEYALADRFKNQVLDGRALGYINFFCGGGFMNFVLLMALPSERNMARR